LRGRRDEPFAVRESFALSPDLIVERAAAVILFGVPAYGVFVNEWIYRYRQVKATTTIAKADKFGLELEQPPKPQHGLSHSLYVVAYVQAPQDQMF
jgi:hypothetical protein